jgi:transposase InsO family protein
MCTVLGIDKTRTTRFRPQSNGGVERFNRTLASMLTMYCEKNQETWENYLQQVMMAYRSSVHASTTRTPNSMLFGREITLPLQALIP